jgi:hypothetical protein
LAGGAAAVFMTYVSTAIICPVTQIVNQPLSSKVHALKSDNFWRKNE